ncbi:MAG: DUF554 domain-containing protein [Anaerolineaceae bacterium]|jgi:uncharacterized membrane protein YqgA involved in biofilm formation
MTGTIINFAAVILGSLIGLVAGKRIPEKTKQSLVSALGLFTLAYGIFIFGQTNNMLIPLFSLVLGTILGELLKIEEGMNGLGEKVQGWVARFSPGMSADRQRFVTGFVSASLLFCIGPMAILGSLQDGISGNYEMLAIKSLLDGIASIAFASTLGIGVAFSAGMVFLYQGAISLLAQVIGDGFSEAIVAEMTATGGIILAAIGISSLLEIKKIRIGSFLPALFIAILIVWLLTRFGISY